MGVYLKLFMVSILLVSCESETKVANGVSERGESKSGEAKAETGNYLDECLKKWQDRPPTGESESSRDQASCSLLKGAKAALTSGDFAYFVEKISDDLEGDDLIKLHGWLADLAIDQSSYKEPKWFSKIGSPKFKEGIAYSIGIELVKTAPEEKETVFSWFEVKKEKIRFMLGFGIASIPSDPNKAFNGYLAWGVKNGALEPFPELIQKLPDNTDFKACDAKIPRSQAHIAVACRKAIYERWAEVKVVQLIDHLVASQLYYDDLHIALLEWSKQNAEGLEQWMGQVEASGKDNPAWDVIRRIRVEKIMATESEKAWNMTREIRHESTREILLRKVHAIWIKTDYKAADEARKKNSSTRSWFG